MELLYKYDSSSVSFNSFFPIKTVSLLVYLEPINNKNPSSRTGPQDFIVPTYDSEDQQKTQHKYAINQVTQCESEPQDIESTTVVATLYYKPELKL